MLPKPAGSGLGALPLGGAALVSATGGLPQIQPVMLPQSQMGAAGPQTVINPYLPPPAPAPAPAAAPSPAVPPPAAAPESFMSLIGNDPEAAIYYALLQGGLKTMASAGTPGATALGSVGAGLSGGITDAIGLQAASQKAEQDKALLGIKSTTAKAALVNALKGSLGETEKLMRLRDSYVPGSKDWNTVNAIIEKKGQFSEKEYFDAVEKTQNGIARIKEDPNWSNDPEKIKQVEQLTARITKLTSVQDDPTVAALKAITKGNSEFLKERAKKHSATLDTASEAMYVLPSLTRLEARINEIPYSGGFASSFDRLKQYVESIGSELGFSVPYAMRSNPDLQLTRAQSNELVTSLLKSKMGSRPSDRDLEFLISTLPGLGLTKEANERLINTLRENSLFEMKKGMQVMQSKLEKDELPGADEAEYNEMRLRYQEQLVNLMKRVKAGTYRPSARMKDILSKFASNLRGGK